ncbi:MAG: glycosyl transferase [Allorhizobium sp.]
MLEKAMGEYRAGRLPQALALAEKAAASPGPANAGLMALIGNIHFKLGDKGAAADAFARAGQIPGDKAAGFLKLAVMLYDPLGRVDEILEIGSSAVTQNPGDSELAFIVGNLQFSHGRRAEMAPALANLDWSVNLHLALIINHDRLSGRFDRIYPALCKAVAAEPRDWFRNASRYAVAREVCDFAAMTEYEQLMQNPEEYWPAGLLSRESALARILWCEDEALNARPSQESLVCASTYPGAKAKTPRRPFSPKGERITIGYLSNDLCDHATMTLFSEALVHHDREKFDVVLFCHTEPQFLGRQDTWPPVLRDNTVSVRLLDDKTAAALIDARGVDILVDLKGHTMGARLGIVNLSDAPVKVTYLGFPGSVVGVDLDYAVSDPIVTPDASRPFYREKLCRLPETYQANNWQTRPLPKPVERAEASLPEDAFVFASFNATYKITPRTMRLWARVLNAVPGSVFWILCPAPLARKNLLDALAAEGVARERVIFAERKAYPDHISRLALADLGLDTFPYNGHTTTSDMLWAGLPVLTVKGKSFASRVSASLLHAADLAELVAEDDDDYVTRAMRLAADPQALSAFSQRMDKNRFAAPLFDAERFARHLERGYEAMAERARAGLAPDHLDVAPLPPRNAPFNLD